MVHLYDINTVFKNSTVVDRSKGVLDYEESVWEVVKGNIFVRI